MLNQYSVLEHKLRAPESRVTLLPRDELVKQLNDNKEVILTTVVSPAGFGKTMLLAEHYKSLKLVNGNSTIWISIDAGDNEANQFLRLFCHALVDARVCNKRLITRVSNSSAKMSISEFIKDLLLMIKQHNEPIYIFLDDFHFISDPLITHFINTLTQYSPYHFHIIISSRVSPSLGLNTLYSKGELFNISSNDLKFNYHEVTLLLKQYICESKIKQIYEQTEGWPVAVQLLLLRFKQNTQLDLSKKITNNIYILNEYIREQIFEKFDIKTQEFLLNTSFLDSFDIELVNHLLGNNSASKIIENINDDQALIISTKNEQNDYRYHHLFSDFLQQIFIEKWGQEKCNALRCKAAKWFARKGLLNEAISQSVRAGDTKLATQLISEAGGWELIMTKGIGFVESLLSHFKLQHIIVNPTLGLLKCYLYLKLGDVHSANEQFCISKQIYKENETHDSLVSERDFIILSVLVKIYLDSFEDAILTEIRQGIKHLKLNDHFGRGILFAAEALMQNYFAKFKSAEIVAQKSTREMQIANCWVGVNYIHLHHGQSYAYRGQLNNAKKLFDDASRLAEEHLGVDSGLQSMSMCFVADIYYQMGDLHSSQELLNKGISVVESKDCWYDLLAITFKLAINIAIQKGEQILANEFVFRGLKVAIERKIWRLEVLMEIMKLKIACHFKDSITFENQYKKIRGSDYFSGQMCLWQSESEYYFILSVYYLMKNISHKSLLYGEKLFNIGSKNQMKVEVIKAELLHILLEENQDDFTKVIEPLSKIIDTCNRNNFNQVFFELPSKIELLLIKYKHYLESSNGNEKLFKYIKSILKRFNYQVFYNEHNKFNLSRREQQIIPFLKKGMSNKQISSELGISENTVKFHLKNLFLKMNVANRKEAMFILLNK